MSPALLSLVLGALGVVAGQSGSSFDVWTEPPVLVVERGGSLRLWLRSDCGGSRGLRGLETANKKRVVSDTAEGLELELQNVTEGTSNQLFYTCDGRRKSKDVQLLIYEVPQRPELSQVPALAPGESWPLVCAVAGAVPTRNLTVTLRLGHHVLGTRTFAQEQLERVEVTEPVPVGLGDNGQNVTCQAQLDLSPFGPVINVTSVPLALRVCDVPKPLLNVTSASPAAGTTLGGVCAVPPEPCAEFLVRVHAGGSVLAGWARPPLPFRLEVGEEHEGTELSCEAGLARAGSDPRAPRRGDATRITVHVKPRLDEQSCPSQQNWTEGHEETLRCQAWGNPGPLVECARDGQSFPVGTATPATRQHTGTYQCWATNPLGTAWHEVTVWVQYHDRDPLVPVLVSVLGVAVLGGVALIYYVHHRRTRTRRYRLTHRGRPRPPGQCTEVPALNGAGPQGPGGAAGGAGNP